MFTPQQIEQISFSTAARGYNKAGVDAVLGPLTEDYITLYKENALLKSKMKVLVSKLEEYRANEVAVRESLANTKAECDQMVQEAEAKCAQMIANATETAAETAKNADGLIAAENDRVEEAKQAACASINELKAQLESCLQALTRIQESNRPAYRTLGTPAFDYEQAEGKNDSTATLADEISANLQALVGTTEEPAVKIEPRHPVSDTTTKFANLQFGRNYEVSER